MAARLAKSIVLRAAACSLTLWASTAVPADPLPAKQTIAITDVTVVDVEHARSTGPRTVLIDAGRIVAIVAPRDAEIPANAQRVDGRGQFLIPGLVDMHVHLFNLSSHRPPNDWAFPLFIANGVTAVREMRADAASMTQVRQWRQAVDDGELIVPHVLAAGIAVHGSSPEDAARQVDAAGAAGADFIKIFSELPAENLPAILAAAKRRSLPVVGHTPAGLSLLSAAAAGLRSNEHLMQAYEACSSMETGLLAERAGLDGEALVGRRDAQEATALSSFDRKTCRRLSEALAATGQSQVPTLVLANEDTLAKSGTPDADPRWRFLRPDEHTRWQRFLSGYTANDARLAQQRWPVARRIVSAMHRAGVRIMTGTDSPMPGVYPGYALHEEMAMLVESGLSEREALRSATLAPAQFLGIAEQIGSVTVGKRADLVLLDADPLQDIRNTQKINAVLLDGRLLRRAALDEILERTVRAQTP
jgi:imidazolonepropionase-like amidohydrolase